MRLHQVIVANGAAEAVGRYTRGRSASLYVSTAGESESASYPPFVALQPNAARGYVHIFDEANLDLVLQELDTAPEFIAYLRERERIGTLPGVTVVAQKEQDLLAAYIRSGRERRFALPNGADLVLMPHGLWDELARSNAYAARALENRGSYTWDRFIEHFTSIARSRSHGNTLIEGEPPPGLDLYESALRVMASEPRFRRRVLARWMLEGAQIAASRDLFSRSIAFINGEDRPRGYVITFVKPVAGEDYRTYRRRRLDVLRGYIFRWRLAQPALKVIVGITTEGYTNADRTGTEDLMVYLCDELEQADLDAIREYVSALGIAQPGRQVLRHEQESEFPSGTYPPASDDKPVSDDEP